LTKDLFGREDEEVAAAAEESRADRCICER